MDPYRAMLDLYGEDPAQPVELYGAENDVPQLPWLNQQAAPQMDADPQNLSQKIQEWLGAKEPDQGGMATDILSGRFNSGAGPSYGDYSQGVVQSAMGKPQIGNPSAMKERLEQIALISKAGEKKYQSVGAGQKLVDPSTGQVMFDAGPAEITPYQREYLNIQRDRNNLDRSGTGKPPTGYRWLPDGALEPIPGGPGTAISAELSARLGLANKFLGESQDLKNRASTGSATGPIDYVIGAAGFGESGKIQRRIADGADALQRMLTGAGMPASEAADYANRFRVTGMDTSETITDKLTNLEQVLRAQIEMSTRGRGQVSTPSQPQGNPTGEIKFLGFE